MNNICIEIRGGEIICVSSDSGHPTAITVIDYDVHPDAEGPVVSNPEGVSATANLTHGLAARNPERVHKILNQCCELPEFKEGVQRVRQVAIKNTH